MTPDVSICIATYRRPRGLERLLDSLARQKLPPGLRCEIVVVDNDAAGSAGELVEVYEGAACDVRYVVEAKRNIAHARNCAIAVASGEWLAFIDDDEIAAEDWVARFWECAAAETADGFFGPVIPELEKPSPAWIASGSFYSRPRHETGSRVGLRDFATSNAFVRRRAFKDHRFDPAWGVTGGSDLELFDRLAAMGAVFAWCDEAVVVESIPQSRQNLRWLTQRAFRGGVGFTRLQRERDRLRPLRTGLRGIASIPPLLVASLFGEAVSPRVSARAWLRACTQAGHLWALAGRSYSEYAGLDSQASLD